jgi:T-complex protein 1 subunit eta
MEISKYLRQHARTIAGKSQLFINAYAKALEVLLCTTICEVHMKCLLNIKQLSQLTSYKFMIYQVIPRQLCDNAGFDATDVLNKLRQKHASGWFL